VAGAEPTRPAGFLTRLEAKYRPSAGAAFLEDPTAMIRLHLIAGAALILNPIFLAAVLLANGEATVGWSFVALSAVYALALFLFVMAGRSQPVVATPSTSEDSLVTRLGGVGDASALASDAGGGSS
jgi:hypothetical protein